ncbi:Lin0368 family putative glycerol transporter subunit [Enterococcus pingfangensis]|uniref:Lin0368 family putative glycerol transporter subunit n=1 Tax=Enterococcus pingfangensis TaxID=2559924 RepID=UPI0010F48CBA
MSFSLGFATLLGSFLFPFFIRIAWGKMVDAWGPAGGLVAATLITGTIWTLNHGISTPMITQSGTIWVDMGLAAGVGCWVATAQLGFNKQKSLKNIFTAIIGGIFGAGILTLFL